jgi:hypothetical protein
LAHADRGVVEYDEPNGTYTQYLVRYGTGAVTGDVHEMIIRCMADADLEAPHKIHSIWLIVSDEGAPIRVSVIDCSDGRDLEWEIVDPDDSNAIFEYVRYSDDDDRMVVDDDVYVEGFTEQPSYPQLAPADN